jgi:hypothetical protein
MLKYVIIGLIGWLLLTVGGIIGYFTHAILSASKDNDDSESMHGE